MLRAWLHGSKTKKIITECQRMLVMYIKCPICEKLQTRMSANAQRDGRPAEYMWRPLFNAAKFG